MAGNHVRVSSKFDDNISSPIDKIRDRFEKLRTQGAKPILAGAAAAVTAKGLSLIESGAAAAMDALKGTVQAASNLQQSTGAVESVFGRAAGKIEQFGLKAADAIGLSKNEVNELGAVLGAQLQGMGFSLDAAAEKTLALQQRAADMAATFGGTTREAVEAIASLMRGERDPIEKYGVSIKAADVSARILAKGLDTSTTAAKKNAEAVAGLELLMEATAKTSGQFGRESDSLAGLQQRLGAKMENLSAKIGMMLIPVIEDLVEVAIEGADALDALADKAEDALSPLARLADAVGDFRSTNWFGGDPLPTLDELLEKAEKRVYESVDRQTKAVEDGRAHFGQAAQMFAGELPKAVAAKGRLSTQELGTHISGMISILERRRSEVLDAAAGVADATYDPLIAQGKLALIDLELNSKEHLKALKSRDRKVRTEAQVHDAELRKQRAILLAELEEFERNQDEILDLHTAERDRILRSRRLTEIQDSKEFQTSQTEMFREQWAIRAQDAQAGSMNLGEAAIAGLRTAAFPALHEGQNLGHNYAKGIISSKGELIRAVREVTSVVGSHLKLRSPAKEGPLSEAGGPGAWGEKLGDLWSKGIESHLPKLGEALGPRPMLAGAGGGGSGFGIPALAGAGGAPVVIQLQVDGRTLAEIVDRNLYYSAPGGSRLPRG